MIGIRVAELHCTMFVMCIQILLAAILLSKCEKIKFLLSALII